MQHKYLHLHAIAARMTTSDAQAVRLANMSLALSVLGLRNLLRRDTSTGALDGERLMAVTSEHWLHPVAAVSEDYSDWDRLAESARGAALVITKWKHLHDWIRASQEVSSGRKAKGAYATPYELARALARLTIGSRHALPNLAAIVDPSCGGGALLLAVLELWTQHFGRDQRRRVAAGLFGMELDPVPHELACLLITIASGDRSSAVVQIAQRIRCANALTTAWRALPPRGFDALIMNPPWESLRHGVNDESLTTERELTEQRLLRPEAWNDGLPPLYSAQGRGDRNLYKAFMELAPHLIREGGRLGALVPSAFASDLGGTQLRRLYESHLALDQWTSFENLRKHFPIDSRYKFGVLTATRSSQGTSALRVRGFAADVEDLFRPHAKVTGDDLRLFGGQIASIPDLTSQGEVDTLRRMLTRGVPFFGPSALRVLRYRREVDMTFGYRDGAFVRFEDMLRHGGRVVAPGVYATPTGDLCVPLVEGRMVGQFDPWQKSWVSGSGRTALWSLNGDRALADCAPQFVAAPLRGGDWRVAICDVTSATNTRTVLATLVPQSWPCGNTAPVLEFPSLGHALAASAVMNSLVFDWLARRIVSGLHLNKFYLGMLSWPQLSEFDVRHLEVLAREIYRRTPRIDDALSLPGHADDEYAGAMRTLPTPELAAAIEFVVAQGYGLGASEIEGMMKDDRGDRRGFWRFYRSVPSARQTISRLLQLLRGDPADGTAVVLPIRPAVA